MMDGCSTMAQWSSMYHHQQHGLETSGSMSLTLDPIHEHLNQEIMGPRISWIQANATRHQLCSSLPLSGLLANNNVQSQPNNGITSTSANSFDQQSLECCLFSGTNSNTDTSVEDDGISMIFSDCKNFSNFNSDPTSNNINNNNRNNNHPICPTDVRSDNNNSRKRSNIDAIQGDQQGHPTFTIRSRLPTLSSKKRQRNNTNNNGDKFRPAKIMGSSNISFQQGSSSGSSIEEPDSEAIQQMKEMIYQAAAFRPVNLGAEMVETPKRKNVRISSDPQTVAARQRRERISERLRVLQKIVPGGSKMDTASMLDEAANYLKFLRNQVKALEGLSNNKVDHYNYSPNHTTNLLFPPINLQFSSLPFPMQTTSASPFSL